MSSGAGGSTASRRGSSTTAGSSTLRSAGTGGSDAGGSSSAVGTRPDTVGSLLAEIATLLNESLRILMFADKRQWGPDEFHQTRALEEALDGAKKDFQDMSPLVHGQFYYENDRTPESIAELRDLGQKFSFHAQNFRDWARQGGPINPSWGLETADLSRELHRAQCRAARRIFAAEQDDSMRRCLGAWQVYRQQQRNAEERRKRQREREELPPWQQQREQAVEDEETRSRGELPGGDPLAMSGRRRSLEELVPTCNAVGRFMRLGDREAGADGGVNDAAFACDFCDGYIVWPDLRSMPSVRAPFPDGGDGGGYPNWQARGQSCATAEEKTIVFAPLAIANHMAPEPGDWQAGLICPYCEEATYVDEGEDSAEVRYEQDEMGFADLMAFQAHLEWYHTALPRPSLGPLASVLPSPSSNCRVM